MKKVTQVNIRHLTSKGYSELGRKYYEQKTQVDGDSTTGTPLALSKGAQEILKGEGIDMTALEIERFEEGIQGG